MIGGICYDFSSDGVCKGKFSGITSSIQGKRAWKNGKPVEFQWIKVNGKRKYYAVDEGYLCRGIIEIDRYEYNFGNDGVWDGTVKKVENIFWLDNIADSVVSLRSEYYDGKTSREINTSDKKIVSEIFETLRTLKFGRKYSEDSDLYFDALGTAEPVMFFAFTLKEGRELAVLFMQDRGGQKCVGLDLHSREEAGEPVFFYKFDETYKCDYSALRDKAADIFSRMK